MKTKTPKYRRQINKSGNIGFVELDGKRHYLGKYDSPESKQRYRQIISEWMGGNHDYAAEKQITVVELVAGFWRHAQKYYRKSDGTPTSEIHCMRQALKPLKELYGYLPVHEFGPIKLKAVRQQMIDNGWARTNINKMTGRIKFIFRWATENELISPEIFQALNAVTGLKRGRCDARETDPVRPVPSKDIKAIESFVSPQIRALIQLQLYTAARAGELLKMRPIDLDMTGDVWSFQLEKHKTEYRGLKRIIYIGPRGQEIIRPFLKGRPINQYLFSPREAEVHRHSQTEIHRRPDQKKNLKKTSRIIRDCYSVDSYRRAIHRACVKTNIPVWTPHRLRHTSATDIREDYGLEAAQVFLGHASCDITQVYAEANQQKAIQIAQRIG